VPFPFDLVLQYLRTSPSAVVELIEENAYHRAVRLLGKPAVLSVSGAGEGSLGVQVQGDGLGQEHLDAAVALTERVFATRADMSRLEADVAGDPIFAVVAARFRGVRPVLIADPFETMVWAILGQQINVRFAATLKHRLVEQYGERVQVSLPSGPHELLLFPRPEALTDLSHDRDLRPLQFSRQKSEYTILVAREIADDRLDLDALRDAPPDEALERLMQLKGIGRWTAEYMLMRGFGHPDAIPAADGGLRRIIGREYGMGRLATEAEVREISSRWTPWRSYASFYWWFTLQLEAQERTG
jgi:DNA-3-methyladenine glycosylase II